MTRIDDAIKILRDLGMPPAQQNDRSGLTLLAVLDVKPRTPWSESKKRMIRVHDVMRFIEENYRRRYAENTRETIRRQTLHQFEQAGIVTRNPDDPARPTNSPNNVYQITNDALRAVRLFGTTGWSRAARRFQASRGALVDIYDRKKQAAKLRVTLPRGPSIAFSPGKHNALQIEVISNFVPRFASNSIVLYVGDTARKMLHIDQKALSRIGFPMTQHDKLPDAVLFDETKRVMILVEAVTAHGPISPKRHVELEKLLSSCKIKRVYVSAFPDFREFGRHASDIAWETEIWIADNPEHMIHFNGPKFITAYE